MADGIDIEAFNIPSGLDDVNLENVFYGGSVGEVLGKFGQTLMGDLRNSIDSKGLNATGRLNQSMEFNVEVFGGVFEFTFSIADYYSYLDRGVNGSKTAWATPYSFKGSGLNWQQKKKSLEKWIGAKAVFGGLDFKERQGLAFGIMKKQKEFGLKPTRFYSDVMEDGRVEKLQQALIKAAGDDINGLFFSL